MGVELSIMGINLAAAIGLMICVWLLSLGLRDASIVDIFWGLGFVLIAWLTFFQTDGYIGRRLLITVLVSIWGIRLATYIGLRKKGAGEDRRYRDWRANYGDRFWWVSLFTIFGLQGLLLWVITLVVQVGQMASPQDGFLWLDGAGLFVWVVGFAFEAIGDLQLARFKADPANRGAVMDHGLWAYTRHPNYFGESLVWWGMFLITITNPKNAWTIISPLLITVLLLRVSGVALLERKIVETRPAYREYIQRTSAFLPWFPKRKAGARRNNV